MRVRAQTRAQPTLAACARRVSSRAHPNLPALAPQAVKHMGNSPSSDGQSRRRGQRGQERLKSEISINVEGLNGEPAGLGDVVMSKKSRQSWRSAFNEGSAVSAVGGAELPNRINAGVTPRGEKDKNALSEKRASAALGADLLRQSMSGTDGVGELAALRP